MGIIQAAANAVSGSLSSQWLEYIVSDRMDNQILVTRGVRVTRTKNGNVYTPTQTISNGSKIMIAPNQLMILCDGGQIVDYCASEGYYEVWLSSAPSMFNGELGAAVRDTFQRIRFGGQPSATQEVYFVNLQEIKGLKFGTRNPIQYFDNFYNAELFIRCHGTYSIRITDPLKFFEEVVPHNSENFSTQVLSDQCLEEFLMALQGAVSIMSQNGVRASNLSAKNAEIINYLQNHLDPVWKEQRGIDLISVGLGNISYDDKSRELIDMRNRNTMLHQEEPAPTEKNTWSCFCGTQNHGNFCTLCGRKKPEERQRWECSCGVINTDNFCSICGKKKPVQLKKF